MRTCQAGTCEAAAITQYTDGDGERYPERLVWLCEYHGDLLGFQSFPLKPTKKPKKSEESA